MNARVAAVLASLAVLPAAVGAQEFPRLSGRVPHFEKRLKSTRWQVRYCLLGALDGTDAESRRALELLCRDENDAVASQALHRYERNFIQIDRTLFRPELYFRVTQFLGRTPATGRDLVDRCLARLQTAEKDATQGARAGYDLVHLITVVGVLGTAEDATQLHRFLDSENDYVALHTARAVIRLGDTEKGTEALVRLAKREPAKHLHYVTRALRLLKELEHPQFKPTLVHALGAVDRTEAIQPSWLNEFLLLAVEIDENVWAPKASDAAEPGQHK